VRGILLLSFFFFFSSAFVVLRVGKCAWGISREGLRLVILVAEVRGGYRSIELLHVTIIMIIL